MNHITKILFTGLLMTLCACSSPEMERDFQNPPEEVQTGVYWYWISGNISKEGVIADLHAMKQAGIAYATDQIIDLYANGITNVHVYSMNKPDVAAKIQDNLSDIIER